jgi:hypothetical protein
MKLFLLLTILLLSSSLNKEEPKQLTTTSLNLLELLEKVKEISNQLAQESLLELPPEYIQESSVQNAGESKDPN